MTKEKIIPEDLNTPNDYDRNTATQETEKSKVHFIVEFIEHLPDDIMSKTIIEKATEDITFSAFHADEELTEKISSFDTYIQVLDGSAEITMNKKNIY